MPKRGHLAIDDMNGPERWEKFLRPILDRLKQIDGRAPVSIMTVSIDPPHPQLQKWLGEGLSLEVHTVTHRALSWRRGILRRVRRPITNALNC